MIIASLIGNKASRIIKDIEDIYDIDGGNGVARTFRTVGCTILYVPIFSDGERREKEQEQVTNRSRIGHEQARTGDYLSRP